MKLFMTAFYILIINHEMIGITKVEKYFNRNLKDQANRQYILQ